MTIAYVSGVLAGVSPEGQVLWRRNEKTWTPQWLAPGKVLVSGPRGITLLEGSTGGTLWEEKSLYTASLAIPARSACVGLATSVPKRWNRLALASLSPRFLLCWERSITRESTSEQVGPPVESTFATDEERLFVLRYGDREHEGEVWALDLLTGEEQWRFPVHEVDWPAGLMKWRPQVSASGKLVFRTDTWLVCLDAKDGKLLWKLEEGYGQTVYGERVYLANRSRLRVLDIRDGSVLLDRDVGRDLKARKRSIRLTGRPAVSETHIFGLDEPGTIWAFDRETGEPVWDATPEGTTGFIGNEQPVIDNGRLYVATFSTNPKRPQSLYCFEQVDQAEVPKGGASLALGGVEETKDEWGPLGFEIVEQLDRRTLSDRAPYYKPGRGWSIHRCRLTEGGAGFFFGEKSGRKTALGTSGEAVLWVPSAKDGDALLKAFRKALGQRKAAGEQAGRRVKTPTVLNSFSLVAADVPELRKWTSLDGGVEVLVSWDPEAKRGAFLEKDETYRKALVELVAGLVVR